MTTAPYGLFEAVGLELEYIIVDDGLNVAPITDKLLSAAGGLAAMHEGEAVRGALSWSNELVLHVLEIKNGEPVRTLTRWLEGL